MHVAAMNDTSNKPMDEWEICPPGELQRLLGVQRRNRRAQAVRRSVLTGGAALFIAAATGVTLSYLWPVDGPATRGHLIAGVYCDEVSREMPDLIARRLKPQRAEQLRRHVANCPDCQRSMQQMGVKMPLSLDGHHHHRDGECPYCNRASTLATIESSRNLAAFLNR